MPDLPQTGSIEIHYENESWIQFEHDSTGASDWAFRAYAPRSAEMVASGTMTHDGIELFAAGAEHIFQAGAETSMAEVKEILAIDDPVPSDFDPPKPAEPPDSPDVGEATPEQQAEARGDAPAQGQPPEQAPTPAEQAQADDPDDDREFSELSEEEQKARRSETAKKAAATRAKNAKK